MKLFECLACGQPLYFENTSCESCGRRLGFLPNSGVLSALEPAQRNDGVEAWQALAAPEQQYRFCCNAAHDACNWLVPAEADGALVGLVAMRDHSHLYHLFVAPAWQGRGLARALWQQVRQAALEAGNPGRFTVNASVNAVPVYGRFGFVATGPRVEKNGIAFVPMVCNPA